MILPFIGIFFQVVLFAQPKTISLKRCSVKTLNYEQGLLNNSTVAVVTDVSGFTWVSTNTSLQRYNGYAFENINPVADGRKISINYPVYFFTLANGNIWISYKDGVLEYCPRNLSFKKIINIRPSSLFFPIIPLKETTSGIWCLQQNTGIVIYRKTGEILKALPNTNSAVLNSIIPSGNLLYKNLISYNNDWIYIANESNIYQVNTRNEYSNTIHFNSGYIYSVTCSNDDKLYVLSADGLYARRVQQDTSFKKLIDKQSFGEKISYGSLCLASANRLLLSINRHLYQTDTSAEHLQEFIALNKDLLLATGGIQKIYTDKFRRIWLLTNNDIKRLQDVDIPFDEFNYPGEKNNFIRSIYFDQDRHIVIAGGYNGSIQVYDTFAKPLLQKPISNAAAGYILAIEKLSRDNYLLYTYENGLFVLNLKTKKITEYGPLSLKAFQDNNFENGMQRLNDSILLISTSKNIYRCIITNGNVVSAEALIPATQNMAEKIGCFISAERNVIWAGTLSGTILKLQQGSFKTFLVPGNFVVRSIAVTNPNRIWAGTEQGLYLFDSTGNFIKSFMRQNGLLNDCIYALLPAAQDAVFASSNLGLSYLSEEGRIKNFTKELGLQENEFNTGAAIRTNSGKFMFGGVNGISAFYAANLAETEDAPVLNLTRFIVNDSFISPSSSAWKNDTVILKYNQNRLQLDFAALGAFNNSDYQYTYRLKGFEEGWQQTHQPTGIKYNLTPGTYTLEIACSYMLSTDNLVKKNLTIIIKQPFWRTWWFETAAAFAFMMVIFFIMRYFNRQKYLLKIKELQSRQKIQQERERISRELHDNIGSQLSFISSNIDWLIDRDRDLKQQEKVRYLKSIHETAKNIMGNLRETIWALNKETILLSEFSDKLKSYIINLLPLKPGMHFSSEEHIAENINFTSAEALHIFRICQEVLNNVIKHAEASVLKLSVYSDKKNFTIVIEDNGKGFNTETKKNGHYGLENMQFRARELNAELSIRSTPAAGTAVSVTGATNNTNELLKSNSK